MKIESILKLLSKLKGNEADLYSYMLHSFVEEMVDFESFDEAMGPHHDLGDLLNNIAKDVDPYVADQLLTNAVEFVITNYYPMPGQDNLWNCIEYLLTKRKLLIKPDDAAYLRGLNNSYMSIYEVLDVNPGQSITLHDMIEPNKTPVTVKEILGSQQLCKWDVIGARVVNNSKKFLLSGVILSMSRDLSKDIIDRINFMTKIMSESSELRAETKAMGISDKDFELQNKKLWIKEIVEGWYLDIVDRFKSVESDRRLLNYEGDPLRFSRVEFSINVPQKKIADKLNQTEYLAITHGEKGIKKWLWLDDREIDSVMLQHNNNNDKQICIDSRVQSVVDSSLSKRLFADVELTKDRLIIHVNSTQRAHVAADIMQTVLSSLVRDPLIIQDIGLNANDREESEEESQDVSEIDVEKIRHNILDEHYANWINMPIPALSNKTPKQAIKMKEGRLRVIDLIKDMMNMEIRAKKNSSKHEIYNFNNLLKNLEIQESEIR